MLRMLALAAASCRILTLTLMVLLSIAFANRVETTVHLYSRLRLPTGHKHAT